MNEYVLEMNNISKSFPGIQALDNVTLKVRRGTGHALLGENGAGKSTLMKILIGMYKPDQGEVLLDGMPLKAVNMRTVLKHGISMIYQELNPLPDMTVAENIYLGREPKTALGLLSKKQLYENTQELLNSLDIFSIDPKERLRDLTVAKAQLIEIAKAISYESKLIVMDEPTSALTESECEHLFAITSALKKKDVTFIFITHKLDEAFRIAEEATILRDGKLICSEKMENLDKNKIISLMVGREITQMFPKEETIPGEVALSVRGLTRDGEFKDVSFDARKGEILGFSGLVGAGRSELFETIFGFRKAASGEIFVNGKKVNIRSPKDAIKNKMALLTEDRKNTGLFLSLSVKDNMIMPSLHSFKKGPFLAHQNIMEACQQQKDRFLLKTPSFRQIVENLSGGNQQKVLVSRWLLTNPEIIIMDEPTRGIDVGAKSDIHRFISGLAKQGKCVIMISSELPEIIGMSDRIMVMHEGRLVGSLSRKEATQMKILNMATGQTEIEILGDHKDECN